MPPPSPLPKYIYKILPHHSINPQYAFPIPIPASHEFFLSPLDAKDGFLHFSTLDQLEGTLTRFFTEVPKVTLLKCDLNRLSGWKIIKWDESSSGTFPHLYAQLEGEMVESFKELIKKSSSSSSTSTEGEEKGLESWSSILNRTKEEGWLI